MAQVDTSEDEKNQSQKELGDCQNDVKQLTEASETRHNLISNLETVNKENEAKLLSMTKQLQEWPIEHKKLLDEHENCNMEHENKLLRANIKQLIELFSRVEECRRKLRDSYRHQIEEMRGETKNEEKVEKDVVKGDSGATNPDPWVEKLRTRLTATKNEEKVEKDVVKEDSGATNPWVEVEKIRTRLTALQMELGETKLQLSARENDVKHLTEASETRHNVISNLETVNKKNEGELLSMTKQLEEWPIKHKKLSDEHEKLKKDRERDKNLLADYGKQVKDLHSEMEENRRERESYRYQIEEARGQLQTANSSSMQSINMTEQIEMLKQQISVYADDFANERSDRERIQADREAQKERIKECERDIPLLKEQVKAYRDDFDKERRDKERLQRLLRERSAAQNRVLLQRFVAEKRENETLQRLVQEQMDEVERARDVIAVARTMADNAMNDLEVVDPTILDVEEVNDVP